MLFRSISVISIFFLLSQPSLSSSLPDCSKQDLHPLLPYPKATVDLTKFVFIINFTRDSHILCVRHEKGCSVQGLRSLQIDSHILCVRHEKGCSVQDLQSLQIHINETFLLNVSVIPKGEKKYQMNCEPSFHHNFEFEAFKLKLDQNSQKLANYNAIVCGFNDARLQKKIICPKKTSRKKRILLGILAPSGFVAFAAVIFVIFRFKLFRAFSKGAAAKEEDVEDPMSQFLDHRHLLPPVFTYQELETATSKFDGNRKIGHGGFGSVYRAKLRDGRIVAVKRHHKLSSSCSATDIKSFYNEITIFSAIKHPNLVELYGYCCDPRGLFLVYDYVPNGTLADHLHGSKNLYMKRKLTWKIRVDLALQIAMAVEYLHFSIDPPVVHRDITSSNIFIEKHMNVKVGDFGLSRLLHEDRGFIPTVEQGTPGYLDPDYHMTFVLTEKSDIYSFGVVLMELITSKKPFDISRSQRDVALVDMVVEKIHLGLLDQILDPIVAIDEHTDISIKAVAELAFRCVAQNRDDRPNAREAVAELRRIRNQMKRHRNPIRRDMKGNNNG